VPVLVVTRYVVPQEEGNAFAEQARAAVDALRAREGCLLAVVGRAADDVTLWTLTTRWKSVGSYRRALGSIDVKVHAVPLMYRALDEATAFEEVLAWDGEGDPVEGSPALVTDSAPRDGARDR
jgi:quinol monooxygenase YgiN